MGAVPIVFWRANVPVSRITGVPEAHRPGPTLSVLVLVLEPGSRGRSPSRRMGGCLHALAHDRAEEIGVYEYVYE